MESLAVLETCLYADDLRAAEEFYGGVLGFEVIGRVEGRHVFFRLAGSVLLVFRPEATLGPGDSFAHGSHGPGHCCFRINASEYDSWKQHLEAHGVSIVAEQDWPQGGKSCYFRDPAGNLLELAPATIWGRE